MLIIRKPDAEEEIEKRVKTAPDPRPEAAKIRKKRPEDEREDLNRPDSLFWRGVWMTVF
ncbi:hypothetical protein PYH37_001167 [Sinorhizobium numidicum]|uniref:Uncharacterized protein n=1 Tax=Sinorhizobium numidicum TaxID=680248 RepID=A0ABY8CMH3_9HYPH|nr:hypothetical protein [Sinorhizobium numidicum]WEX73824.1 hypothetical protein PYH37_001167 [Sinorhizobium numidicum]WEX79809.1 hypothetical protein PYH38_001168 [Sinorhizobium numidicum]